MIDPRHPDYTNTPVSPLRPSFQYAPADPAAPPCITVLTPTLNPGPLLDEAAACLARQSFQQWEWLIVNDGSDDPDACRLLDAYRGRDPRIRVLDLPAHEGVVAARNHGFAAARCEYVFSLDDDDLIEPTALEKLWWFLQSHPEFAAANSWSTGFGEKQYLWDRGFERGPELLEENPLTVMALLRRAAYLSVGGYEPRMRGGLEDWDFWLRFASAGLWGGTVPEYLAWYRRRADHGDRWENLKAEGFAEQRRELQARYGRLREAFPRLTARPPVRFAPLREELAATNRLAKERPRLLLLVPWMTLGGGDKFNLDVVRLLNGVGWEVTIAATLRGDNQWLPEFTRLTPDVFVLDCFLKPAERAVFVRYLIESRQPDVVLITNSELAYQLLPYLRATCPGPRYVDYCHIEEETTGGGFPRYAISRQAQLDLNIVSSKHLKNWMIARGAAPERIAVAYTNIDPQQWQPDQAVRRRVRAELEIPDEAPILIYPVRLTAQKQPRVFARVMRGLVERGLPFYALVAGDGPDANSLETYLDEHQLTDVVRMLGTQPNERVRELMIASDILFLPSEWEGISLCMYEAMACGLAVVGAVVGGQAELVTADCGVLIERATEEVEVARYVDVLADLIRDPRQRHRLGARARVRIVEHFTLDRLRDRLLELFARAARLQAEAPRRAFEAAEAHEMAVQAVEHLRLSDVATELYKEVRELCAARELLLKEKREIEAARDWFKEQAKIWEEAAGSGAGMRAELVTWLQEVEKARDWHLQRCVRLEADLEEVREYARREAENSRREHEAADRARQECRSAEVALAESQAELARLREAQQSLDNQRRALLQQLETLRHNQDALQRELMVAQSTLAAIRARFEGWRQQLSYRMLRSTRLLKDLTLD